MLFLLIPISILAAGVFLAGRTIYKKIPNDLGEWDAALVREDFGPTFYQKAWAAALLKSKEIGLNLSTKLVYRLKITSLKSDNFFSKLLREMRSHKNVMDAEADAAASPEIGMQVKLTPVYENRARIESSDTFADELEIEEPKVVERDLFAKQEQQFINQLAYNPKDVSAYKRLGWLYLENKKPVEARQAFKMAVKLGSRDKIIITKLLEMGGTVHKEGVAPKEVLAQVSPKSKTLKSKPRKLKVKKV